MSKRNILVYLLLALVWLAVLMLQIAEHRSYDRSRRESLRRHARDLSISLGVVIRSQRRFGFGTVHKNRLQGALQGLAEAEEVLGITLFNPMGGTIAQAGARMDPALGHAAPGTALWGEDTLTVVELAEFGPEPSSKDSTREGSSTLLVGGGPPPPGGTRPPSQDGERKSGEPAPGEAPPPPEDRRHFGAGDGAEAPPEQPNDERPGDERQGRDRRSRGWGGGSRRGPAWTPEMRERFRKWMEAVRKGKRPAYPPWMTEEEYQAMFREQGLHKLAFRLSATDVLAAIHSDLRQRQFLVLISFVAVVGLALLYRQMSRSAQLGVQLVRAEAMNNHLREMNLAAAGLAHETRNPLNVVRGLAQLLARDPSDAAKAADTSARIVDEVDRVSNRLNEFIAYSKPREPVTAPVDLRALAGELADTLRTDCEERGAELQNAVPEVRIRADEGMLRQVLFNILMNSLQAIPEGGTVRVSAAMDERRTTVCLRIADDGPGVPEEIRGDVFRPYVSARDKGTGLGLAVVRQIVLAHHWQIECGTSPELGGAEFSIHGMQIVQEG
jgi:signal transduction histidine kinase